MARQNIVTAAATLVEGRKLDYVKAHDFLYVPSLPPSLRPSLPPSLSLLILIQTLPPSLPPSLPP